MSEPEEITFSLTVLNLLKREVNTIYITRQQSFIETFLSKTMHREINFLFIN